MKVSINELKSMIAKIIKEEKSKTFTKSKAVKKLSLNELRGLVKNIIKEEMGGGEETIFSLFEKGLVMFEKSFDTQFVKLDKPITNVRNLKGLGVLTFREDVPATVKFNVKSTDNTGIKTGFKKFDYIEGDFNSDGLNNGRWYAPAPGTTPDKLDPFNPKKPVTSQPILKDTIIPRVAANPNTRIK